jgi:NAD(P)-dependent dehydrogenase (short-subunit alcohol dehydrogenase family)
VLRRRHRHRHRSSADEFRPEPGLGVEIGTRQINQASPRWEAKIIAPDTAADPEKLAAVMVHTPLGRLPSPEDVADAVLFLASDAARSITGHVLAVDSGYLAR